MISWLKTLTRIGFSIAAAMSFVSGAHAQSAEPYAVLREAYARADGAAAAQAYAVDGVYLEDYAGSQPVERRGRAVIAKGFTDMFAAWDPPTSARPIDLDFRFIERRTEGGVQRDVGIYRLRVGRAGAADATVGYGRFETEVVDGVFRRDRSSAATREDFETAPGPVLFTQDDEVLDAGFHDPLLGVYADMSGCEVIITRSVRRLFALDTCTREWRGLNRVTGSHWTAPASAVIAPAGVETYRFEGARLRIGGARALARQNSLVRERVTFPSGGLTLAGTIIRPAASPAAMPGVVLLHGSGPQDRHGYASVIELIAVQFARAGVAALIYDKRGVGASQGDWSTAGFSELGADARAAQAFLATRAGIDRRRIGFAGSSQAGWVAAKAIEDGATPAFVMLLGAAGAGSTVREQNLYNTRVRMQCAGIAAADITLALDQQRAFFDARKSPALEAQLAAITARAAARPALADWLFPATARRSAESQWYDVLDPDFDPTPVWRGYRGRTFFVFADLDDSTETVRVVSRTPRGANRVVRVLQGAQHLGLETSNICAGDLDELSGFHRDLWPALDQWAKAL